MGVLTPRVCVDIQSQPVLVHYNHSATNCIMVPMLQYLILYKFHIIIQIHLFSHSYFILYHIVNAPLLTVYQGLKTRALAIALAFIFLESWLHEQFLMFTSSVMELLQ